MDKKRDRLLQPTWAWTIQPTTLSEALALAEELLPEGLHDSFIASFVDDEPIADWLLRADEHTQLLVFDAALAKCSGHPRLIF